MGEKIKILLAIFGVRKIKKPLLLNPKMKIIPQLRKFSVSLRKLKLDSKNVIQHKNKNLKILAESLKTYGQRKPIIVNKKTRVIEAGNGTYLAAKSLGWTKIAAIFVDDDAKMSKKFSIMDNKSGRMSGWDISNLFDGLDKFGFEETGFSKNDLRKIVEKLGDFENVEKEFSGFVKEVSFDAELFTVKVSSEIVRIMETMIQAMRGAEEPIQKFAQLKSTLCLDDFVRDLQKRKFIPKRNIPKRKFTEDELFYLFICLSFYHYLSNAKFLRDKLYSFRLYGDIFQIGKAYKTLMKNLKDKKQIPRKGIGYFLNMVTGDKKVAGKE